LGILNTKYMNIALTLRLIWKLYQNEEGLWEDLLRAKYLGNNDLFSPAVPTSRSQFWRAIRWRAGRGRPRARRGQAEEEGEAKVRKKEKKETKLTVGSQTEYAILGAYFTVSGLRGCFSTPKTRLG
jgi:hypothetical protein